MPKNPFTKIGDKIEDRVDHTVETAVSAVDEAVDRRIEQWVSTKKMVVTSRVEISFEDK